VPLVEDNPADISLIRKAIEACDPQIHLSIVPKGRDATAVKILALHNLLS
jgi:hypothetical protein